MNRDLGARAVQPLRAPDTAPATRGAPAVSPLVVPPAPPPDPTDPDTTVIGRNWRRLAACAGVDPELFYPVDYRQDQHVRPARRVCGRCPVRARCLADVMATEDPALRFGVCGGTTPEERSALFRAGLTVAPSAGGDAA